MRDRALESIEGSLACIKEAAYAAKDASDQSALDAFAKDHAFRDWMHLHTFMQESAILLDTHTASYEREIPADRRVVWEFLADPKKLQTWMFEAEFEARPGALFNFAPRGWHGRIGIFKEGYELRFDAVAGGWTWFILASSEGGTLFTLRDYMAPDLVVPTDVLAGAKSTVDIQPGGVGTHWQGVLAGWHQGVDDLRSKFTGYSLQWDYEALCRLYNSLIVDYHRVF